MSVRTLLFSHLFVFFGFPALAFAILRQEYFFFQNTHCSGILCRRESNRRHTFLSYLTIYLLFHLSRFSLYSTGRIFNNFLSQNTLCSGVVCRRESGRCRYFLPYFCHFFVIQFSRFSLRQRRYT